MLNYPKVVYKNGIYRDDYKVVNDETESYDGYSDLLDTEIYIYTTDEIKKTRGKPKKVEDVG